MAYEKHTWQSSELVTAEKLNHIEQGIDQSGGARWDVSIAVSDWTANEGIYTYSTALLGISEASWVDVSAHGYEQYFSAPIDWEVMPNDIITFTTTAAPSGTIEVGIGVWGGVRRGL